MAREGCSRRTRRTGLLLALVAGLLAAGVATSAAEEGTDPACVAVVTPTVDTMRVGAGIGPGTVIGIGGSAVSLALTNLDEVPGTQPLQDATREAVSEISAVMLDGADRFVEALDTLREQLGALRPLGGLLDALVAALAGGADELAATFGAGIAPFDRTFAELGDATRYLSSASCGG